MLEQVAKSKVPDVYFKAVFCNTTVTESSSLRIGRTPIKSNMLKPLIAARYVARTGSQLAQLGIRLLSAIYQSPRPLVAHANDFTFSAILSFLP
jgi:hypothetical protein